MNSGSPSVPERIVVDAREAARLLSISERTLFTLTKAGRIPCVRLGRSVRYSVDALRAIVMEAIPAPEPPSIAVGDGGPGPLSLRE